MLNPPPRPIRNQQTLANHSDTERPRSALSLRPIRRRSASNHNEYYNYAYRSNESLDFSRTGRDTKSEYIPPWARQLRQRFDPWVPPGTRVRRSFAADDDDDGDSDSVDLERPRVRAVLPLPPYHPILRVEDITPTASPVADADAAAKAGASKAASPQAAADATAATSAAAASTPVVAGVAAVDATAADRAGATAAAARRTTAGVRFDSTGRQLCVTGQW